MSAYIHHHDAKPPFIICPSCVGLPMYVKDVAPHWSMAKIDFTYAFLPWHLIEKRFLRLRRHFSQRSANIAAELHPELPIMRNWCGHLDHRCPADRFRLPRSLELGYE
jgi:hypothetical protein